MTSKRSVKICVTLCGRSACFTGLVDSGNLLCDPVTGDAVIIVSADAARRLLNDDEAIAVKQGTFDGDFLHLASRYRIIPARGVGERILLHGLRADSITVCGRETRCVIALSDETAFGGEYECVIPAHVV